MNLYNNFLFIRPIVKRSNQIKYIWAIQEAFLQGVFFGAIYDLKKIYFGRNEANDSFPSQSFLFIFSSVLIIMSITYLFLIKKAILHKKMDNNKT